MDSFLEALITFRNSKNAGTQFDISDESGRILMQVYKNKDVRLWGTDIDFQEEDGYIVEVRFAIFGSKAKRNEKLNKFLLSRHSSSFRQFDNVEPQNSYFSFLDEEISNVNFHNFLVEFLRDIYGEDLKITYVVRGVR